MNIEVIHHWTGVAVDLALLVGAIAAAIRFRIFNVLGYRWRTDVTCRHADLPDGFVIFLADYVVRNTGRRPLKLTSVTLEVFGAAQEGPLLVPDLSKPVAARTLIAGDPALKGIFQIEPGERSIFPLRARLDHLADYVFVVCTFATAAHRTPTVFRSFYAKALGSPAEPEDAPGDAGNDDD